MLEEHMAFNKNEKKFHRLSRLIS